MPPPATKRPEAIDFRRLFMYLSVSLLPSTCLLARRHKCPPEHLAHRSHEGALGAQATHNSVAPRSVPQRPTCDALHLRSRDRPIHCRTVPMLYRWGYFVSLSAISAFLESASYTFHKAYVNRGSNPCRGANLWFQCLITKTGVHVQAMYKTAAELQKRPHQKTLCCIPLGIEFCPGP